ncbi:proteasomal ubiquitin receptor ADRM1 homolog [Drosophila kikkawai]|uniref:Proteasomal ubiquitin receptor ADRM1 homolog n=1 Tax=Drosophila kikkawai TaxID=30033 RepID=A0ABM4GPF8_DROKI
MTLSDKTIEPDDRKGLLYLRRSPTDNQLHINWMDRRSGDVELDILVTPLGHLEFQRVEACMTGRVYVLRFCHSTQRHYFWMQEPDIKRDAEVCRRINELLLVDSDKRSEDRDNSSANDGDVDSVRSGCGSHDLQWPRRGGGNENLAILEEVRQIFAKVLADSEQPSCRQTVQSRVHLSISGGEIREAAPASSNTLTSTPAMTTTTTTMTMATKMTTTTPMPTPTPTPTIMRMRMRMPLLVDLAEALRSYGNDAVENLLISPSRRQALMARMPPRDPDDEETTESELIREHLRSPQSHRALSQFSYALSSGIHSLRLILGPLLLGQNATEALEAAQVGDIERFLRALHRNERD